MNKQQRRLKNQKNSQPLIDFFMIVKYFGLWILFALICYGVKAIVMAAFQASPTNQVGNGILTLYEVHNTGAAFNLFAGHQEMIITASLFAVAILTFIVLIGSSKLSQTSVSAMAALSAGIVMNMIERIHLGYVIDYIHCEFLPTFPVFNFPDIMIVVGAVCLILSLFTKR